MSDNKRKVEEEESVEQQEKRPKTDDDKNANGKTEAEGEAEIQHEENQDSKETSETEAGDETEKSSKKKVIGGELLIAGGTNWDLVGRKGVPKGMKNVGGRNLWGLHRVESVKGKRICTVSSGCVAVHSVIVDDEGQAYTWGRNDVGQLGQGHTRRLDEPTLLKTLSSTSIVQVACGKVHTLFLTEQGRVYSCGENKSGQLGTGEQSASAPVVIPTKISYNSAPICRVACGAEFSMIVDIRGNLYSFGCPEYGQCGHNTDGKYFVTSNKVAYHCETRPRRVAVFIHKDRDNHVTNVTDVEVKEVACGVNHTVVIDTKGRVFTWGFGGYGRLGHNQPKDEMIPRQIPMFEGNNRSAVSVSAGGSYTLFVTESGMFYMCGINKATGEAAMYPKMVQDLAGWKTRSMHSGFRSIIIAADESLVAWGPSPTFGELAYGEDDSKSSTIPKESKTYGAYIEKVGGGYGHLLAIARTDTDEDQKALGKIPTFKPDLST